jgi:hypothetical protein
MKNKIIVTPFFESKYKRLAKKFPSLSDELQKLAKELINNPKLGVPLGEGLYKIRLAIKEKVRGKSGGFRVITYLIQEVNNSSEIYLITIYDKSEDETISKNMLIKLVKSIFS